MLTPHTLHVPSKDLRPHWAFVKRGLDDIIKKTHPEWLTEDIYVSLVEEKSLLLLAMCGHAPVGFTISYFNNLPFSNKKELFIWCAWTMPPGERHPDWQVQAAINDNFDSLVRLGQQAGAYRLTCMSPRPGFGRWAQQFGFKHYLSTFERLI